MKLLKKLWLILLSCLFITSVAVAQNGSISGVITDSETSEVLIGATVLIQDLNSGAASTVDGYYNIRQVPAGPHTLIFSYLGYSSKEIDVMIESGEHLELNVAMTPSGLMGEEVLITVQALGQRSAIRQQISSNTISNVVSSERIRDVPDVNAAESLGRLPGVSIQRSGGEANKVSIRGLSPKYNTVSVNGVALPSTDQWDRSVDLSLISSEMLDGIEVRKALTPDQDADALGGSIDLKLREAPVGFQTSVQVQGGYNQLQDYYGNYRVSASISNRSFDNRLGYIVNLHMDDYDRSADSFNASYRAYQQTDGSFIPQTESLNVQAVARNRGRTGGSAVLDYSIDNGKIVANAFYNQLTSNDLVHRNNYDTNSNERDYSATDREVSTSIGTAALGIEQKRSWFEYDALLSVTQSNRHNPYDHYWSFVEESAFISTEISPDLAPEELPNAARSDISNTRLADLSIRSEDYSEQDVTFRANMKIPFTVNDDLNGYIKFGGRYRHVQRENDQNVAGVGFRYGGGQTARDTIATMFPELGLERDQGFLTYSAFLDANFGRESIIDGRYPLGERMDVGLMNDITNFFEGTQFMFPDVSQNFSRDYTGTETFTAGFVMAELRYKRWLTFMPGFRVEYEESEYTANFVRSTGSRTPPVREQSASRDNMFILPMVHLRIFPTEWLDLRLAYTHSLTRPDFQQIAPRTYVNEWGNWVDTGNPDLTPARSVNYDASVSVYNNTIGLFTVSGFYKQIEDLIWHTKFYLLPNQQVMPGFTVENISGVPEVDASVNNPYDAYYRGLELDWQTHFWYLPSVLDGLVFSMNYTRIWSETKYPQYRLRRISIPEPPFARNELVDTLRVGRMPDQPSDIMNVTLGYDYEGFSVRVSYLYQTDVLTSLSQRPAQDVFTADYSRWDVVLKQRLPRDIELFANLNNITDTADRRFQAELGTYPTYQENYGFTMDLGVRVQF